MAGSFNNLPIPREPSSGRPNCNNVKLFFSSTNKLELLESGANEKELCISGSYVKV